MKTSRKDSSPCCNARSVADRLSVRENIIALRCTNCGRVRIEGLAFDAPPRAHQSVATTRERTLLALFGAATPPNAQEAPAHVASSEQLSGVSRRHATPATVKRRGTPCCGRRLVMLNRTWDAQDRWTLHYECAGCERPWRRGLHFRGLQPELVVVPEPAGQSAEKTDSHNL